ncbi:MAG: hypothetical protein QOG23_2374 [Blastocatellia bacterium]|nr:hypothetical protein [Blastocatellia bacterium]
MGPTEWGQAFDSGISQSSSPAIDITQAESIPRSDRFTGENRVSRQVAPSAEVELCFLCLPPGFPAVPHHFNLSPVASCPSQNRACAINAHGSPDNHSGSDGIAPMRSSFVSTGFPLLCAAGVSLLCSTICRLLPSGGITRLRWYYETIRLPAAVLLSSLWAVVGHTLGLSPLNALSCSSESSGRVSRVAGAVSISRMPWSPTPRKRIPPRPLRWRPC